MQEERWERCVTCRNSPLSPLLLLLPPPICFHPLGQRQGEEYEDRNGRRAVNRVLKHPRLTSGLLISFRLLKGCCLGPGTAAACGISGVLWREVKKCIQGEENVVPDTLCVYLSLSVLTTRNGQEL